MSNTLNPESLQHASLIVAEAHERKEYRPVGVALVEDALGSLLMVQSVKNPDDWWFPQGGVEVGEDVSQAVLRESQEEVGILPHQLTFIDYFGSKDLDAEAGRVDRRGFTRGKRYLFFHLLYQGPSTLTLQESELADYMWVPRSQIIDQLATTRPEKTQMLRDVIQLR